MLQMTKTKTLNNKKTYITNRNVLAVVLLQCVHGGNGPRDIESARCRDWETRPVMVIEYNNREKINQHWFKAIDQLLHLDEIVELITHPCLNPNDG